MSEMVIPWLLCPSAVDIRLFIAGFPGIRDDEPLTCALTMESANHSTRNVWKGERCFYLDPFCGMTPLG